MDRDDLINNFLNVMMMPLVCILLCFILPPFFIFKSILNILSRCHSGEDLRRKVVLVTGASSGIGEHLVYEYARRGACLAIVARREDQLKKVAETARGLGSPQVIPICGDVSNVDDCKRFVEETVNQFGRLDHLVNNAGISSISPIEDVADITKLVPVMNVNFWGAIYPTFLAIPHLKRTKGKIIVNTSASAFLHSPKVSLYTASKAALIGFYETMRSELAPEISITIITPGLIDSEMSRGKHLNKDGLFINQPLNDIMIRSIPVMGTRACAGAIVDAVCGGERYVTVPKWYKAFFLLKALCPQLFEWAYRIIYFKSSFPRNGKPSSGASTSSPFQEKLD